MLTNAPCVVLMDYASGYGSPQIDSQNRHATVHGLWPSVVSWAPILDEGDTRVAWRMLLTRSVVMGG